MIKLNNAFYIDADKYNYILKVKQTTKKGKQRLKEIGYHSNVKSCIEHFISLCDKQYISTHKNDYKTIYTSLENNRKEIVEEIKKEIEKI